VGRWLRGAGLRGVQRRGLGVDGAAHQVHRDWLDLSDDWADEMEDDRAARRQSFRGYE
jgi:hypothetical protein